MFKLKLDIVTKKYLLYFSSNREIIVLLDKNTAIINSLKMKIFNYYIIEIIIEMEEINDQCNITEEAIFSNILSNLSYQNIIEWKLVNKYFNVLIDKNSFWFEIMKLNYPNLLSTKKSNYHEIYKRLIMYINFFAVYSSLFMDEKEYLKHEFI